MKAYIAVSYKKRKEFADALNAVTEALHQSGITPFIFADTYKFKASEEKQMMAQAMSDIEASDLLIAEVSDKAIGIGVEAGYAKAKGKPVIYTRHTEAGHSTTLAGISDYHIMYEDAADLKSQLEKILQQITGNKKSRLLRKRQ